MDQGGGYPRNQDGGANGGGDDRHERSYLRGGLGDGGKRVGVIRIIEPIDKRCGPAGAENRIKGKGRGNPAFFVCESPQKSR